MTEQPTTPPEPPVRPMPRLGRGVRWSAHIDGDLPPTQPYKPATRPRPTGWPKTGDVGASAQLRADEEPVTVPARPYGVEPSRFATGGIVRSLDGPDDDSVPFPVSRCLYEQPRAEASVFDVTKPGFGIVSIAEARSWGIEPPPAVELLAMADDLNTHGGLDERFVAGLLLAAMPPHLIGDHVPDPMHHEQPLRAVPDLIERPWWRRTLDRVRRWTR